MNVHKFKIRQQLRLKKWWWQERCCCNMYVWTRLMGDGGCFVGLLLSRSPPPFPLNAEYMCFRNILILVVFIFLKKKKCQLPSTVHFPTHFSWARASLWKYLPSSTKVTSWILVRQRYSVDHHIPIPPQCWIYVFQEQLNILIIMFLKHLHLSN